LPERLVPAIAQARSGKEEFAMSRWRFRKSIRVAPGVRLNIGKRGVGMSVGGKGLRVGVGTRGAYTSVGIPGTGIYGINYLSQRGTTRAEASRPGQVEQGSTLAVTDPREAAGVLRREGEAMESAHLRQVIRENFPDLLRERIPGGAAAILIGIVILIIGQWWGVLLLLYGIGATIQNSSHVTQMRSQLLRLVDEGAAQDERRIEEDLERARDWKREHASGTALADLADPQAEADSGLLLGEDELVCWAAPGAVKVRELASGTRVEGHGTLVITDRRLVFLGPAGSEDLPLRRILSAEVDADVRLRLAASRRKTPLEYIALGSAHTAAVVIQLARAQL
jgi:hypothetical protein